MHYTAHSIPHHHPSPTCTHALMTHKTHMDSDSWTKLTVRVPKASWLPFCCPLFVEWLSVAWKGSVPENVHFASYLPFRKALVFSFFWFRFVFRTPKINFKKSCIHCPHCYEAMALTVESHSDVCVSRPQTGVFKEMRSETENWTSNRQIHWLINLACFERLGHIQIVYTI